MAEVFTGTPGVFVKLEDTIRSFAAIVSGEYDHLPEAAFYMVGTIEEAVKKGENALRPGGLHPRPWLTPDFRRAADRPRRERSARAAGAP